MSTAFPSGLQARLEIESTSNNWRKFVLAKRALETNPPEYILSLEDQRNIEHKQSRLAQQRIGGSLRRDGGMRGAEMENENFGAEAGCGALLGLSFPKCQPLASDVRLAAESDDLFRGIDLLIPQEIGNASLIMGVDVTTSLDSIGRKVQLASQQIQNEAETGYSKLAYIPPEWEYAIAGARLKNGLARAAYAPLVLYFARELFDQQNGADLQRAQELLGLQLAIQANDLITFQARLLGAHPDHLAESTAEEIADWLQEKLDHGLSPRQAATALTMQGYIRLYQEVTGELANRDVGHELYEAVLQEPPEYREETSFAWRRLLAESGKSSALTQMAHGTLVLARSFREATGELRR